MCKHISVCVTSGKFSVLMILMVEPFFGLKVRLLYFDFPLLQCSVLLEKFCDLFGEKLIFCMMNFEV